MAGRSRLIWAAAVSLFAGLAVVGPLFLAPHDQSQSTLETPAKFHAALTAAGLHYNARPVHFSGLILRPVGDTTSWEELESALNHHANFEACRGCLFVQEYPEGFTFYPGNNKVRLDKLLIRGHPDDLPRIFAAIGR